MTGLFSSYLYFSFGLSNIGTSLDQAFILLFICLMIPVLLGCIQAVMACWSGLVFEIKREKQIKYEKSIKLQEKSVELLDIKKENYLVETKVC